MRLIQYSQTGVSIHGNNIFRVQSNKSIYYDLKARPLSYLNGMIYMASILEVMGLKTFQFLPMRTSIVPKNIIISTSSLAYHLVSYLCGTKTKTAPVYIKEKNMIWSWFLDYKHPIFKSKNYIFDHSISTDGISCSLRFIRKDLYDSKTRDISKETDFEFPSLEELSPSQIDYANSNMNVVGCDPGKRSLVYMHDIHGNKLEYTCIQRRFESRLKQNKQKTEKLKSKFGINQIESVLTTCDSKTVNYQKFKEYLQRKVYVNSQSQNFYNHPTFRKMRLRSFIEGRRSEDKFIDKIGKTFGKNCFIAYGNWSRNDQMKHFMSTMGVGLRRLIHRKYHTYTVNEAYSSKKCCECLNNLRNYVMDEVNYKDRNGTKNKTKFNLKLKAGKNIHRLLVCSNCVSSENKRITFRSRDKNAAINIMNIAKCYLIYGCRHPSFIRSDFRTSPEG